MLPCRANGCRAALRVHKGAARAVDPAFFSPEVDGITLDIEDDPRGGVAKIILHELRKSYGAGEIPFQPGDVVIDIGAHVGVVSVFLAKRYPGITVYAFEPWPDNHRRLVRNIVANGVGGSVRPFDLAVTSDGREIALGGNPEMNTGGISGFCRSGSARAWVQSVTLAQVFEQFRIERCKLLKLDCEGAEHEIISGAGDLLDRVDYLSGEFHMNSSLAAAGWTIEGLSALVEEHIGADRIRVTPCRIAE